MERHKGDTSLPLSRWRFYRSLSIARSAFRYFFEMAIFINPHAQEQAVKRGTNEEEIIEVWQSGFPVSAKYGRKGKAKVFDFKAERLNQFYEQKRVEIFYIEERDDILIITVYVFYGKWE